MNRESLRKRIAQADADVYALGCMLNETKQVLGDRIAVLEKTVATLESENSGELCCHHPFQLISAVETMLLNN